MPLLKRIFALCLCACLCAPSLALAVEDAILAVVDSEIITVQDLVKYMRGVYSQLKVEGKTPQEMDEIMREYQKKGIEQLIEDRLVLGAAEKAGIKLKPQAVNERLEEIKAKYPSFDAFLEATKAEGLTVSDVKKKIEDQIKGQVIVNLEVRDKVHVNPQEVTDHYQSHREEFFRKAKVNLGSIFVRSTFDKVQAEKKAREALAAIKAGGDFKEVAVIYSDLPSVGIVSRDELSEPFRARLEIMRAGDVSDVIETPEGFYILKIEGETPARQMAFEDVREQLYQQIFQEKFRARFKAWLKELREKAYVEIKG
ncbi:MAG: hypothetical protein GX606_04545 [Elusimicrobia bacterium]|nr:hypothetical protein [Elusimicrobiota bacterium]